MSDESFLPEPVEAPPVVPDEPSGLLPRVRAGLSLPRVQVVFSLIAALLSIGGGLYGYLRPGRAAHAGDLVAVVQDARTGKVVADATVEVLTPRDALVTMLGAADGEARSQMKEGAYRLRVSHPRFGTEIRKIQVIAGQTTEIRVRLAPR
jgi:hypothetical protein